MTNEKSTGKVATFTVEKELWKWFKSESFDRECTLSHLLNEALTEYKDAHNPR